MKTKNVFFTVLLIFAGIYSCSAKLPTVDTSEIFSWLTKILQIICTVAGALYAVFGTVQAAWKYSDDHSQMWRAIGMSWAIGGVIVIVPNAIAWLI